MKRFRLPTWTVPIAILLICLSGYGLLIRWLGFFQDDWYQIWFGRAFGTGIFVDYYSYERPFIAGLYLLTTPIIGDNPTSWQIFGIFTRFLAAISLWWTLKLVWRNRLITVTAITILFALYPGFRQQWAAVIYSHYFLQFAIQCVSLGLMILAVRRPRQYWLFTSIAIVTGLVGLLSSEYFFGLELLRPIFLWLVIQEDQALPISGRWRRFFLHWLPYLSIMIGFLVWRIFIFQFPTYQPVYANGSKGGLISLVLYLAQTIASDVVETGLAAWFLPFKTYLPSSFGQPALIAALLLSTISAGLIGLYLWFVQPVEIKARPPAASDRRFALLLIGIGLFTLLASGWPFWFVDLKVNLDLSGGSRLTLSFMLGASLFIVGLIELIFIRPIGRILAVSLLAGLAIGHHFIDANTYRQIHKTQAEFFQQLAWRAPGIEPNTIVLTDAFNDLMMSGDNSLTAALNWIYQPNPPFSLNYLFAHELPSPVPGTPIEKGFRTTSFTGSTSDILVIYFRPGSCLRVLNPQEDLPMLRPIGMEKEVKEVIPLSNLNRIIPDPSVPASLPAEIFKYLPPENSWCHYYEKADLARQQKNWPEIVNLAKQAFEKDRKVDSTWELIPFIEGYIFTSEIEKARQLSDQARQVSPEGKKATRDLLCSVWTRIGQDLEQSGSPIGEIKTILDEYGCQ